MYDTSGKIKEPNLFKDAGQGAMVAVTSYLKGDLGGVFSSISGLGKKIINQNSGANERTRQQNTSPADVIMWSGCKDSQTSADAVEAGKATGESGHALPLSVGIVVLRGVLIVYLLRYRRHVVRFHHVSYQVPAAGAPAFGCSFIEQIPDTALYALNSRTFSCSTPSETSSRRNVGRYLSFYICQCQG